MTTGGWIFLTVSLTFVWGLALWSYWKTLTAPEPPDAGDDVRGAEGVR